MDNEIVIYYCEWDGKKGSHELLKRAAKDWCTEHWTSRGRELEPSQISIVQEGTWTKPYFTYPEGVEFSISHTGNIWMCAVSDTRIGLDVQAATRCKREKLSARFFHPEEDAWLSQNGYDAFFQVWAAKESYLKYTGDGLVHGMERFSVADQKGWKENIEGVTQRHFVLQMDGTQLQSAGEGNVLACCISFQGEYQIRFQKLSSQ